MSEPTEAEIEAAIRALAMEAWSSPDGKREEDEAFLAFLRHMRPIYEREARASLTAVAQVRERERQRQEAEESRRSLLGQGNVHGRVPVPDLMPIYSATEDQCPDGKLKGEG